jgi:hypothetical protein
MTAKRAQTREVRSAQVDLVVNFVVEARVGSDHRPLLCVGIRRPVLQIAPPTSRSSRPARRSCLFAGSPVAAKPVVVELESAGAVDTGVLNFSDGADIRLVQSAGVIVMLWRASRCRSPR